MFSEEGSTPVAAAVATVITAITTAFAAGAGVSGVVVGILWRKIGRLEQQIAALHKQGRDELRDVIKAVTSHESLIGVVRELIEEVRDLIRSDRAERAAELERPRAARR